MRLAAITVAVSVLLGASAVRSEACTAAAVSPGACVDGRPVLWKNRDTGTLSNRVVFVDELPQSYVALVNVEGPAGRQVWAGLNSAGFAIMNTVAYNLPKKSGEDEDLEGVMMADALRTCASVADFERYLRSNLGAELGARANFGVFDADGVVAVFETHNHGFERLDAAATPEGYLVVTNFSRTGKQGDGEGYLRFDRASALFRSFPAAGVDFRTILSLFARDTGHSLVDHPNLDEVRRLPASPPVWINSRDCINRPSTSSAVVLVGRRPGTPGSLATMWVIPGEPVTAVAVPLWVEAGAVPEVLWQGEEAPLWRESMRIKGLIRPPDEGHKWDYLDLSRLDNADGTGHLPALLEVERRIVMSTDTFLTTEHTGEELTAFQDEMVALALDAMSAVSVPGGAGKASADSR